MFSCTLKYHLVFEVGIKLYPSVGFALQVANEQRVILTDRQAEERIKERKKLTWKIERQQRRNKTKKKLAIRLQCSMAHR